MSYQELTSRLKSAKLPPNDRIWFGRWVDAYRRFCRVGRNDSISISRESVIAFLRQQKAGGREAWQRLQMVKAIQFYQSAVLRSNSPPLASQKRALYFNQKGRISLRRESLGEEDDEHDVSWKPFSGTLRVTKPVR